MKASSPLYIGRARPISRLPMATTRPGIAIARNRKPRRTETEANTITLCATIPNNARVTEVEVFAREANSETPWSSNRLNPGKEVGQARFAEKYVERPDPEQPGMKLVCQDFAHWSTEHAQVARMQVRYTL